MKVLDGRKEHEVPTIKELSSFIVLEKWVDMELDDRCIYCLALDNMYVACVSGPSDKKKQYKYILCAEYKTKRGFDNWRKRYYPHAQKAK